jgi:hypothetical protein
MRNILHLLEHELHGLDDESQAAASPGSLVVGVLVLVVPVTLVVMTAALAVYFLV